MLVPTPRAREQAASSPTVHGALVFADGLIKFDAEPGAFRKVWTGCENADRRMVWVCLSGEYALQTGQMAHRPVGPT
jgi:hypothetical protein